MDSETSRIRSVVLPYIKGKEGLDLGYGGDAIIPEAITLDLPYSYTKVGYDPQHLKGDARKLIWFFNSVFDYVYSSHLLEDFENTAEILNEWLRVIKPGGLLILYLPDQRIYEKYCLAVNEAPNCHHKVANMSLDYIRNILKGLQYNTQEILALPPGEDGQIYSFLVIVKKIS